MAAKTISRPSLAEFATQSGLAEGANNIDDTITFQAAGVIHNFVWKLPSGASITATFMPGGESDDGDPHINGQTGTSGNAFGGWPYTTGDQLRIQISGASGRKSWHIWAKGAQDA